MLNPKTNQRELVYIVKVDNIQPMIGYDKIELAIINGWSCVVGKGDFKAGDLGIYFEIDSKLPEIEPFINNAAIVRYKFKIKTQKFGRGGTTYLSQGLLMHPSDFGWTVANMCWKNPVLGDLPDSCENVIFTENNDILKEGDFLTERLGVTYYEPEDNSRKADMKEVLQKKLDKTFEKWVKKHPIWSKFPFVKKIKYVILHKKIFTKKAKKRAGWPSWVVKTDEERCQNMPQLFVPNTELHDRQYVATEKLDGTSTTFTMRRDGSKKDRREFYICSRNVVFDKPDKKSFYDETDGNVYLEMAKKYNMEEICNQVLDLFPAAMFITFQGETYGGTIQKRNYGDEHRCAMFNIIIGWEDGEVQRLNPIEMRTWCGNLNLSLELVPIIEEEFYLPNTCEELLAYATGPSAIDGGMREGAVFRSLDGKVSFKAVSNEFLLKYHS